MFFEAVLRFATLGLLLGLAVISYRDRNQLKHAWLLTALCVTLVALMISTSSSDMNVPPEFIAVCRFIDTPNTVLAWLFVKSLLQDDFRVDKTHVVLCLLYCIPLWFMWLNVYNQWGLVSFWHGVLLNLYAIGLFAHLTFNMIKDWPNDLVESRRKMRLFFVSTITLLVSILIASEVFSRHLERDFLNLLKVLVTFALTLWGFLWFLQINPAQQPKSVAEATNDFDSLNRSERALKQQLDVLLQKEQIWRNPSLTIAELARQAAVGEHTLRAFINQRLGYRNFAHFLQQYRLHAVKQMLLDPDNRDTPVLTIALECGFNSISTFNRVFRKAEGVAPSQYRGSHR